MTDVERAKFGDREAFDALVKEELPKVRAVVRRMVGHPEDTDEVVQEALLKAFQKMGTFRADAAFSTWLVSIATRCALDHLRAQKRWRWDAQEHTKQYMHSDAARERASAEHMSSPEHRFDAYEHIAFCFTCVGRSLPPEEQAALILRDVFEYKGREAAQMLGITESVLRHRLSSARATMSERFENLCALVNQQGVCWQCEGLRGATPEARRGPAIPVVSTYASRLPIVRAADVDQGQAQRLHDWIWRIVHRVEAES